MESQNINVYIRCRPLKTGEQQSDFDHDETKITIADNLHPRDYDFDKVFAPDSSQTEVYKSVVEPLISEVINGLNCTVFAYGQTGTGKTYTMEGQHSDQDGFGLIPRAVHQLIQSKPAGHLLIRVSFLELYNEEAYDLLSSQDDTTKLKIFDDATRKNSVKVDGLTETDIASTEEIMDILARGATKRQTAATLLNAHSSRSHAIFGISVMSREYIDDEFRFVGKLNLVDLAGSENIARSGVQYKNVREAGTINQSLLTLTRVITALNEKRPHIPYRESKLTRILQDSLGGSTRTSMIATISMAVSDTSNTVSTLDYASRARCITNNLEINRSNHNRKNCNCSARIAEIEERYSNELKSQEYKIRNEISIEFRESFEKLAAQQRMDNENYKARVQEQKRLATAQLETELEESKSRLSKLEAENQQLKRESEEPMALNRELSSQLKQLETDNQQLKTNNQQVKRQFEESENRNKELIDRLQQLESQNQQLKSESENSKAINQKLEQDHKSQIQDLREQIDKLRFEIKCSQLENQNKAEFKMRDLEQQSDILKKLDKPAAKRKGSTENSPTVNDTPPKKLKKVPKEAPPSEDYLDLTFGSHDEILPASAKKPKSIRKPLLRKRGEMRHLELSGKKRPLTKVNVVISPSPSPIRTRSRTTRRKLDF